MNIEKIILDRKVPELMKLKSGKNVKTTADFETRREEIKKILQEEEYGYLPEKPQSMRVEAVDELDRLFGSKATLTNYLMTVTVSGKEKSFPFRAAVPNTPGPHPAFIYLRFGPKLDTMFLPTEEIIDNGFAVFSVCYTDVTSDDGNFKNGLAPLLCPSRRKLTSPGKIAMWAWSTMRVMDYVQTLDYIDKENVAVIGHSRLGKTALLTGALDDRFKYVISNDSGCSGAALTRGKVGESAKRISEVFPFWFCPKYIKNADNFDSGKYDQHFLLSLTAPRILMVGSAELDEWADPKSEFLSTYLANEAYLLYGKKGLVCGDEIPSAKTVLGDGDVLYQVRHGGHWLSREDWQEYMTFIRKFL